MIIWLASYPRSGNTYFRILLKQMYGISTYEIYDLDLSNAEWAAFTKVIGHEDKPMTLAQMEASPEYYIVKTHEMPGEACPAIYLVRDGRDSIVSCAHFILHYNYRTSAAENPDMLLETMNELICTNEYFGGWGANVLAWSQRRTKTVVLRYEDLVAAPIESVRHVMREINYQPPELNANVDQPMLAFDDLHQRVPEFFRKGQRGGWKEEMPVELQKFFWARYGKAMMKMGYSA
jgi:hypothetical protein